MSRPGVGPLVKEWRRVRRRSQLDLASEVGVSTRHLSFIETGRSRPSPEVVLALADGLDVPLRERNALLMAAGHAPRYPESSLDAPEMDAVRGSLQRMLDAHDPYPGVVIDRWWNVVLANEGAGAITAALPEELLGPPVNVFRACLHPDGLARMTTNLDEWAGYLLGVLRRLVLATCDETLAELEREVSSYPAAAAATEHRPPEPTILLPVRLDLGGVELSLFTTLTTFGTASDITLSELAVELFFPADPDSEALLRRGALSS